MQVQVKKLKNAQVQLLIQLSPDEVNQSFQKAYQKISTQVKIPGFRKGKIPFNLLRKRYPESAKSYAFDEIIYESIETALKQQQLSVVTQAEIQEMEQLYQKFQENQELHFSTVMESYPEVKLAKYKGIKVSAPTYSFDESDIQQKLRSLQAQKTQIQKANTIQKDNLVKILYQFYLLAKDPNKNQIQQLDLSYDYPLFSPFYPQLIGMSEQQEKTLLITIPIQHPNENLKGKKGSLYIKILEIYQKEVPKINDDFAKDLNFETLQKLKSAIQTQFQKDADEQHHQKLFQKLMDHIIEKSEFEFGTKTLQKQIHQKKQQFQKELETWKLTLDQYLQERNQSKEEFNQQIQESCQRELKAHLVQNAILKKEPITVQEEEIQNFILQYSQNKNISPKQAKKELLKQDGLAFFEQTQLQKKFMDFLLKHNSLKKEKSLPLFEKENEP